jgi:hypothetical protein
VRQSPTVFSVFFLPCRPCTRAVGVNIIVMFESATLFHFIRKFLATEKGHGKAYSGSLNSPRDNASLGGLGKTSVNYNPRFKLR